MSDTSEKTESPRITSIDQIRGYAIFGMLIVNAGGLFFEPVLWEGEAPTEPEWFKSFLHQIQHHRTEFTYADTIAPLFVFVVGMGMRLSWLRRSEIDGAGPTRRAMVKRNGLLILIAFALYQGWLWDALMDISLAGLLAIPLIGLSARARIAAATGYAAAYQLVFMTTSYGTWLQHGRFSLDNPDYTPLLIRLIPFDDQLFAVGLNGGLLGPMSWVMMLLFGTLAWDVMAARNDKKLVLHCLAWGAGLCAIAWTLHIEWPGAKEAWPFSARYMTAPFPLWATGLCFLHLLAFHLICDKLHIKLPTLTPVGQNPLAIYIAQCLILDVAHGFAPEELSLATGVAGFAVFWGLFAAVAYWMQRKRLFFKL